MIQMPNTKFIDATITSMKNTSLNSLFFPNYGQCVGLKHGFGNLENEMDHNLSCSGPIWVIQKPKIKFTDAGTISIKNPSQNSLRFPIGN